MALCSLLIGSGAPEPSADCQCIDSVPSRTAVNATVTKLRGTYAQAGYRPWARTGNALSPLELAFRYAWVDDDTDRPDNDRREWTFGTNWFFSGHDNKLTLDLSRLTLERGWKSSTRNRRLQYLEANKR